MKSIIIQLLFVFLSSSLFAGFSGQNKDTINEHFIKKAFEYVKLDSTMLALETFDKVLENTKDKNEYAYFSFKIGDHFLKLGIYDMASKYLYNAIAYYENDEYSKEYITCLFSLAELNQRIGEINKATKMLLKALDISKKMNDSTLMGNSYNNLGATYLGKDEYDIALSNFFKAIPYFTDSVFMVSTYKNIGSAYRFKNDLDNAMKYLLKAKNVCDKKRHGTLDEAHILMTLGATLISQKDYDNGLKYLFEAQNIARTLKVNNLLYVIYYNIAKSYSLMKEYGNATNYFFKYDSVRGVVLSNEKIQSTKNFGFKYNMLKKENEIKQQDLILKNKNFILVIEMIIIIVLIAFSIFYYYQRNKVNKLYKKLVEQNFQRLNENIPMAVGSSANKQETEGKTEQFELLAEQIVELFEREKTFKDNNLTISSLAEILDTNKTYISKAINIKFNRHFNVFLNEYRIKEAIKMISHEEYLKYTISHISQEVGFNSISVFNSNFKKISGVTPSIFINTAKNLLQDSNDNT